MNRVRKLDQESMRQNNERMVFETIYQHEAVTKNRLARETGLSVMAVSRITDLLQARGTIVERDALENGKLGRPAKELTLRRECLVNVGVSLDVGGVHMGIIDPYGKILHIEHYAISTAEQTPQQVLQQIATMLHGFLQAHALTHLPCVGFVMPGIIAHESGYLRLASQLHWADVPVSSLLESYAPIPKVVLDNDVKARAQAESRFGNSKGYANSVLLTIGSGIGAGIIIDKAIYRGKDNMAGEIGHSSLGMNYRMCECGRMGCAQATISKTALIREARLVEPSIDMSGLNEAYRANVPWARRLLDITAEQIIALIGLLANVYAPEIIILCGSLIESCPVLSEQVSRVAREENARFLNPAFEIGFSRFVADGCTIGAAALAFNHNMEDIINRPVVMKNECV